MSTWGWVALATLSMIVSAQRAEACSCATEVEIVHPSTTSIATWDGLVGRNVFVGRPILSVTYVDDPAQEPIAGTLTNLDGENVELWTFVPNTPLTAGRTIRAVIRGDSGFGTPRSYDYVVTNAAVGAGPDFPGVTTMTAVVSHLHGSAGGCGPSPTEQSRVGFPGLPPPSAEAPIYRYFFYRQGESPPTNGRYGVAGHYISTIRCGNPGVLCEPTFGGLVVGETICARVEALDLLGRASGYASEACATVGEEDFNLAAPYGPSMVICQARTEDAGTVTTDGGGAAARGDSTGCACVRAPDRGRAASMGVLLVGLVLARRRRR